MRECEIFYVRKPGASGWKWRPVEPGCDAEPCAETYSLFYECVTAARARGYGPLPALKCA